MTKSKQKNPHAVALSRKAAEARRRKIPPKVRQEIARKAARARWQKQPSRPKESEGPR